ncbi:hypothetical protein HYH02_008328 [Chlamydomonas schloesseri]|uniref:Uncharacterized protein n=1 Tax=Chlamydomonas schloesseri TaxID=2026947 RepID=A0A836B3S1_9CHLO|nr:hypothetical protein HYH02_008328 [Chlamydomonas schloesseri]|eukprot:KAG2446767.1 hypothetical protein HYH02_008328 [Chlamydomonas schloesseri]
MPSVIFALQPRFFGTLALVALLCASSFAWYFSLSGPAIGASGGGGALVRQVAAMSTPAGAAAAAGGSSPTGAIVVYVTVPSAEVGEALAGKLVEAKLAACVNILPGLTSVYFWDGKVNKDPELLLIIKSREELLGELTSFVRANHPYDEPEVIGLPILGGSPSYLQWLMDNTDRKAAAAAAAAAEKQ